MRLAFFTFSGDLFFSFLCMNEHVIGVSEPLFLYLADFPESTPIVQFSGVHSV